MARQSEPARISFADFSSKYIPDWVVDSVTSIQSTISNFEIHRPGFIDRIRDFLATSPDVQEPSSDSSQQEPKTPGNAPLAVAAGSLIADGDEDEHQSAATQPPRDNNLLSLTKRLIEIRNILKSIDRSESLHLPAIVVIGGQSSGKSSVLEAIVGHSFLPKGRNFVTRRPIELTLIHTMDGPDYAEFPQLGHGKISDFERVRSILTDLNEALSPQECISSEPIELRIYSRTVPDLSLVDLPGYIQVSSRSQPDSLGERIRQLCEKYIEKNNIILAVCAADVDFANSEALRASRRVDPFGQRTVGVVTKMDLIHPNTGVQLLANHDYPLQLGYVGVVCPSSQSPREAERVAKSAFSRRVSEPSDASSTSENQFFQRNGVYKNTSVGIKSLTQKLETALETYMTKSLTSIASAVRSELEEARYQSKVLYNDRTITPEIYAAEVIDDIKRKFNMFSKQFNRARVRSEIREMLEQRALNSAAEHYWANEKIDEIYGKNLTNAGLSVYNITSSTAAELGKDYSTNPQIEFERYWHGRLVSAVSALTRSGIGRASTQLVVDALMANIANLTMAEPMANHPEARRLVLRATADLLRSRFRAAADQVENAVKPYKYEVEISSEEWTSSLKRTAVLLDRELDYCEQALRNIRIALGKRNLAGAIRELNSLEALSEQHRTKTARGPRPLDKTDTVEHAENGSDAPVPETPVNAVPNASPLRVFSAASQTSPSSASPSAEVAGAQEHSLASSVGYITSSLKSMLVNEKQDARRVHYSSEVLAQAKEAMVLQDRVAKLKSRISATKSRNCRSVNNQAACPEIMLLHLAEKLAASAVSFLQVELLADFFSEWPREVESVVLGSGRISSSMVGLNKKR